MRWLLAPSHLYEGKCLQIYFALKDALSFVEKILACSSFFFISLTLEVCLLFARMNEQKGSILDNHTWEVEKILRRGCDISAFRYYVLFHSFIHTFSYSFMYSIVWEWSASLRVFVLPVCRWRRPWSYTSSCVSVWGWWWWAPVDRAKLPCGECCGRPWSRMASRSKSTSWTPRPCPGNRSESTVCVCLLLCPAGWVTSPEVLWLGTKSVSHPPLQNTPHSNHSLSILSNLPVISSCLKSVMQIYPVSSVTFLVWFVYPRCVLGCF